jgi:hypothetical protein
MLLYDCVSALLLSFNNSHSFMDMFFSPYVCRIPLRIFWSTSFMFMFSFSLCLSWGYQVISSSIIFLIILLLYWRYIVTFTKVLTKYHSWINALHHSPLFLVPILGIVSICLTFLFSCMSTYNFHYMQLCSWVVFSWRFHHLLSFLWLNFYVLATIVVS